MTKILGISAFYHDSSASIIIDGKVIAAVQEERFTRQKHTAKFPEQSIRYCLSTANINVSDLDAIVFYDKPFLTFERLLETYYSFAPRGVISFIKAIPVWLKDKLFLKQTLIKRINQIQQFDRKDVKLLFTEHHLSHAASSFYPSSFKEAAILTIDGVGEWDTVTICHGTDNKIKKLKSINFPHSVGLLYSSFTYYLGFRVNSGEYKLMGLAPYGNIDDSQTIHFIKVIKDHLVKIYDDGSIWMNQKYYSYSTGLRMVPDRKWEALFNLKKRKEKEPISQAHCNLALAIQKVTEDIIVKLAKHSNELTKSSNLCLSGGVALNCVANGVLLKEKIFDKIYVQPASGDAGGSLGAAFAAHYIYFDQPNLKISPIDPMNGTYLGPSYLEIDIENLNLKYLAKATYYPEFKKLINTIADEIYNGKIIGWFQDRMEFGPRALGNRSILADPRKAETQKKVNLKIKFRENFRPFAPSVLEEDASNFFDLNQNSPYMSIVAPLKSNKRKELPKNFKELNIKDKLSVERSEVSAITHVDFSSRIQTVNKEVNQKFYSLLSKFNEITKCPILVNTSFNVRGEPIVNTPEDAIKCFLGTNLDYLIIENFILDKKKQNKDLLLNYKDNYELD